MKTARYNRCPFDECPDCKTVIPGPESGHAAAALGIDIQLCHWHSWRNMDRLSNALWDKVVLPVVYPWIPRHYPNWELCRGSDGECVVCTDVFVRMAYGQQVCDACDPERAFCVFKLKPKDIVDDGRGLDRRAEVELA